MNLHPSELRERAARALFRAEHFRSLAKRALKPQAKPFVRSEAWLRRAEHSTPRAYSGKALRWTHEGTTLEVTLEREPMNELGTVALRELEELSTYLVDGAGGARAMILSSALEKGFSAGADLRELYREMVDRRERGVPLLSQVRELRAFIDRIHRVFDILDTVPITTVAAVQGVCFGGGFELALTADVIVADKSARFCFPELRLGLVPGFGGVPRLQRDLGNAVVRDLLLTGRSLRATRAHEVGLVSQVVGRGQALPVARSVATQAARFDRRTAVAAKRFIKAVPQADLDREKQVFTRLFASPVVEAALQRFVESDEVLPYLP
ncbi:MAG: enoyl-CoA hydratase/isomerase family protein [Myxococcota bacterium]